MSKRWKTSDSSKVCIDAAMPVYHVYPFADNELLHVHTYVATWITHDYEYCHVLTPKPLKVVWGVRLKIRK